MEWKSELECLEKQRQTLVYSTDLHSFFAPIQLQSIQMRIASSPFDLYTSKGKVAMQYFSASIQDLIPWNTNRARQARKDLSIGTRK